MILFLKQERPGSVGFCRSGFSGIVLGYPLEDIVGHSDVNSSVVLTLDGIYEEGFHKKSHANVVLHGFCDPISKISNFLLKDYEAVLKFMDAYREGATSFVNNAANSKQKEIIEYYQIILIVVR